MIPSGEIAQNYTITENISQNFPLLTDSQNIYRKTVSLEELPEVEATQPVICEAVSPALEDDAGRLEVLHHALHDGVEDHPVAVVINPLPQRNIQRVVTTRP